MRVSLAGVVVGVPVAAVMLAAVVFGVLATQFADRMLDSSVTARLHAVAAARRDAVAQQQTFWRLRIDAAAQDRALTEWARAARNGAPDGPPPDMLPRLAAPNQSAVAGVAVYDRRGDLLFESAQEGVDIAQWRGAVDIRRIDRPTDLGANPTAFGAAAAVIAPIRSGRVVGYILMAFDLSAVFDIARDYAGLGETGETVIVRITEDRIQHISPVRFKEHATVHDLRDPDVAARKTRVRAMLAAVRGSGAPTGVATMIDYRGQEVFAAARHVPGVDWTVVAKIDVAEALAPMTRLKTQFLIALAAMVAVISAVALTVCALALRHTSALRHAAARLGDGDYAVTAPMGLVRELNSLAAAFERMKRGILAALERERAARDRADAASKAKSRFLATMSHEIRTPMNGVIGAADLLSRTEHDPHQRFLTDTITQSGKALLAVINDVLDFSRLEAQRVEIVAEPMRLRTLIEEVASMTARTADGKGLLLIVDLDPALDGSVMGDAARIRQILVNIIGNAVKFTPSGHVLITGERRADGMVALCVADTGPGIPPERLDKVFQPFEQVDNTVSRRFEGTGLGLAIARRLARAMQGDITVTSPAGEGAAFTVSLPLPPAVSDPAATAAPLLAGVVVALSDAKALSWRATARVLAAAGARVIDGADAGNAARADVRLVDAMGAHTPAAPAILHGAVDDDAYAATRDGRLAAALQRPAPAARLIDAVAAATGAATTAQPAAAAAPQAALTGLRVVAAEDNMVNRMILEQMLTAGGAQVRLTENGAQALAAVEAEAPDLVILDISMPVMDGLTALARLRARGDELGRVPVMMLSAHADPETASDAAQADGFTTKPFVEQTLTAGILATLDKAAARRRAA